VDRVDLVGLVDSVGLADPVGLAGLVDPDGGTAELIAADSA